MQKYTPNYDKIEWHLTYRCTLSCKACSRASFLKIPHTQDMTLEDAKECIRQCNELEWKPNIIIMGGEPTIHPQFLDFIKLARDWMKTDEDNSRYIQVFSNGFTKFSRDICEEARIKYSASIFKDEWKTESRIGGEPGQAEWDLKMYVSPSDAGIPLREVCYAHSSQCCGVGLDHTGYSICPIGLSVSKLLGLNATTKNLKDIFNNDLMKIMTEKQCKHCGFCYKKTKPSDSDLKKYNDYANKCEVFKGNIVSPTWKKVFENL